MSLDTASPGPRRGGLCASCHHYGALTVNYQPRPIATEDVVLPNELVRLTERLAEHNHDLWAAQRMAEGSHTARARQPEEAAPGPGPLCRCPSRRRSTIARRRWGCQGDPDVGTGWSGPLNAGADGAGRHGGRVCQPRA